MAKTTSTYQFKNIRNAAVQFENADGTAFKSVIAATADDSVITALVITSDDTVARNIQFSLYNGVTDFPIETLPVPVASGTDGVAVAVDGLVSEMLPLDVSGKKILQLEGLNSGATWSLRARMLVAVTAAKKVSVSVIAKDF